jgi:hypothetical protein
MKFVINPIGIGDIAAAGLIIGSIVKVLPAIAALLAVIYYGFVIYDRIRYGPELVGRMSHMLKKVDSPPGS